MKDEIDYKSCQSFDELQYMVDDYINYYNNKKK
ncbi:MAG: IS3 family transposase [Terrisporobacter sp.]